MSESTPTLSIHVLCYNESSLLPLFVAFYRSRFPDVVIAVHDNDSTDDTVEVATAIGCSVYPLHTEGQYDEPAMTARRSCSWNDPQYDTSNSTWVLVCDTDEFCDITPTTLTAHAESDAAVLVGAGLQMVGMPGQKWPTEISTGYEDHMYSKPILFRRNKITAVRFDLGSHCAVFEPDVPRVAAAFPLYHYCFLSTEYLSKRMALRAFRRARCMESYMDTQRRFADPLVADEAMSEARARAKHVVDVGTLFTLTPQFTRHWAKYTTVFLGHVARGRYGIIPEGDVVEIGCFEGRSTIEFAKTFPKSNLICIDPWMDGPYSEMTPEDLTGQYGRFLLNTAGFRDRLTVLRGFSQDRIGEIRDNSVALALIDGDHSAEAVERDAQLIWPKLVSKALLLFDDYGWKGSINLLPPHETPKPGIDKFLEEYASQLVVIYKKWQVLIQKI